MKAIAKLFMHGRSQAVRLPKEFRFEGTEVRVSKIGNNVVLEPMEKKPFDAAAWRAGLEKYRDIPFMEDGRDQGTIVDDDDAPDTGTAQSGPISRPRANHIGRSKTPFWASGRQPVRLKVDYG